MLVVFFLLFQDPYFLDVGEGDSKIAKIEMKNIKDYEMNDKKITRVSKAKKAVRYDDRDVLSDIKMSFIQKDFIYNIKSDEGVHKGDIVTLSGDVKVLRSDDTNFTTSKIKYDTKSKKFWGKESFVYESKLLHATGIGLVYDMEKKDIKADDIHAIYKLEKR